MTLDIYEGVKTQSVIDRFKPIVKKSLNGFINETINDKISSALKDTVSDDHQVESGFSENARILNELPDTRILTSDEEIQAFYIIKGILSEFAPLSDITYRDTESYFGILYKDNNRKPICRINLDKKRKQLMIPDSNKTFIKYQVESLDNIYEHKQELIDCVKRYIEH